MTWMLGWWPTQRIMLRLQADSVSFVLPGRPASTNQWDRVEQKYTVLTASSIQVSACLTSSGDQCSSIHLSFVFGLRTVEWIIKLVQIWARCSTHSLPMHRHVFDDPLRHIPWSSWCQVWCNVPAPELPPSVLSNERPASRRLAKWGRVWDISLPIIILDTYVGLEGCGECWWGPGIPFPWIIGGYALPRQACLRNVQLPVDPSHVKKLLYYIKDRIKLMGYSSMQWSTILYVEDQHMTQSWRSWMTRSSGHIPSQMPSAMIFWSSTQHEPDLRQIATIDRVLETGLVQRASAYSTRSGEEVVDDRMTGL